MNPAVTMRAHPAVDASSAAFTPRSALGITYAVWKALLFREALGRLFAARLMWFWLLAEPLAHVMFLVFSYTMLRVHNVGGVDTSIWLVLGVMGFFMFKRTSGQMMNAVNANAALFAYRQVLPIDTVLVRGLLEGVITTVMLLTVLAVMLLMEHDLEFADPLRTIAGFYGIWLFAVGFGLINAVLVELLPTAANLLKLLDTPIYMLSGVMFPVSTLPPPYREMLFYSPIAHGLETVRLGYASHYHAAPETSLGFLYGGALVTVFFGLMLHRHYAARLLTR